MNRIISEELFEEICDGLHEERYETEQKLRNAPVASGVDLSVEWLERFWRENGGWSMAENTKCFEALVNHLATRATTAPASQVGELVMGGPESRYHKPTIGTNGQVGDFCPNCGGNKDSPKEMALTHWGRVTENGLCHHRFHEALRQPVETWGAEVIRDLESADKLLRFDNGRPEWLNVSESLALIEASLEALRTQSQASISQNANSEPQTRLSSMRDQQHQAPVVDSTEDRKHLLNLLYRLGELWPQEWKTDLAQAADSAKAYLVDQGVEVECSTLPKPQTEAEFTKSVSVIRRALQSALYSTQDGDKLRSDALYRLMVLKAPVVEVLSGHAEFVHKLYEIRNEPDKLNAIVMREHALLSRTGGRSSVVPSTIKIAEVLQEKIMIDEKEAMEVAEEIVMMI